VDFTGFDTRIIDLKVIATTTRILGKKRQHSCVVLTGNKNGVIGFGKGKGPNGQSAIRLAKKSAGERLLFVDRYEDRTLYHNFYKEFYYTKVYAQQMPSGYGLRCHRIIKLICELAGIKDLYAKVDGSTNPLNLLKCFISGLTTQVILIWALN
jgi:small subunit ribosomal protein S5